MEVNGQLHALAALSPERERESERTEGNGKTESRIIDNESRKLYTKVAYIRFLNYFFAIFIHH